jgi:hypothetical protein
MVVDEATGDASRAGICQVKRDLDVRLALARGSLKLGGASPADVVLSWCGLSP